MGECAALRGHLYKRGTLSGSTTGALTHALGLIEDATSLEEAKKLLRAAIRTSERQPSEGGSGPARMRGRGFFDRLMEAILERVKQAVSREELVTFVLNSLTEDAESCAGLCYLCLDAEIDRGGRIGALAVAGSALIHPRRLANFTARLNGMTGSTMLQDVLVGRETLEFLPTEHLAALGYNRDYAGLASDEKPLWLCALPLPAADSSHRARMLLVLYPIIGPADAPALPRGATQEWRTLSFLRVAYEMLNHQLTSTREQLLQQRRELLADLAPGIVNHEIYQQVNAFAEAIKLMQWSVHRLDHVVPAREPAFDSLLAGLRTVQEAAARLRVISNAFNNLERRPDTAPVPVAQLLDEVFVLQGYLFAKHGIAPQIDNPTPLEIRSDAALLEHVLLNVIANAIDAIAEGSTDGAAPILRVKVTLENGLLVLSVMNNGTPITLTRPEQVFEKGFTTKPRGVGHGLGLHMCRLVMAHIGGTIDLIAPEKLDVDMRVGFRVTLRAVAATAQDIKSQ